MDIPPFLPQTSFWAKHQTKKVWAPSLLRMSKHDGCCNLLVVLLAVLGRDPVSSIFYLVSVGVDDLLVKMTNLAFPEHPAILKPPVGLQQHLVSTSAVDASRTDTQHRSLTVISRGQYERDDRWFLHCCSYLLNTKLRFHGLNLPPLSHGRWLAQLKSDFRGF